MSPLVLKGLNYFDVNAESNHSQKIVFFCLTLLRGAFNLSSVFLLLFFFVYSSRTSLMIMHIIKRDLYPPSCLSPIPLFCARITMLVEHLFYFSLYCHFIGAEQNAEEKKTPHFSPIFKPRMLYTQASRSLEHWKKTINPHLSVTIDHIGVYGRILSLPTLRNHRRILSKHKVIENGAEMEL